MRAFKMFIFGLVYGWFFKIAFDRIYRENDWEDLRNENTSLKNYARSLELQLQTKSARREQITEPALSAAEPASPHRKSERDNLKVIRGIGPAIEKKLNNAGIYTYEALAALNADELENILGNMVRRLQDEKDLIAQAKRLAGQGNE